MQILTVVGARPQFIKAAVLSRCLRANSSLGINETLLHTGQHYDRTMSEVFFRELEIPKPGINLHIGSGSHGKTTGQMLAGIEEVIVERKPDLVLVYGDTNSTLAGALAACKLHVPVAHVEAGLRSFMMVMPEEQNRRLTDHLSSWLFCPTKTAVDHLKQEGIVDENPVKPSADKKRVVMTGDIMYDASLYYRNKSNIRTKEKNFILLTIHRAENTDNPQCLSSIVEAVNELTDFRFIFPVHPRTRKMMNQQNFVFYNHVNLIEPVGYFEMLDLESACFAVMTDSGGVQKEAFFFKKPCITLRDVTEWNELITAGWNTLAGTVTEKIVSAVKNLRIPDNHPDLYGDGHCAEKIIAALN
jgi:UDP-GlcNAc3NAcA epimerase